MSHAAIHRDVQQTADRVANTLPKTLFFVTGLPRSGTTWLQKLIDAHPNAVCKGEAQFSVKLVNPFFNTINEFNEHLIERKNYIGQDTLDFLYTQEEFYTVARFILLERLSKLNNDGIHALGEKTAAKPKEIPVINTLLPEARYLHIYRDGRDSAISTWHYNINLNPKRSYSIYTDLMDFVTQYAHTWRTDMDTYLRLSAFQDGSAARVRYEDLIDKTFDVLTEAYQFLGVSNSSETVHNAIHACQFEKLSGGRKRGETEARSFYRRGEYQAYQSEMPPEHQRAFLDIAGDMLAALGYDTDIVENDAQTFDPHGWQ